jgi:indole-3-glycerol phosphate synthase
VSTILDKILAVKHEEVAAARAVRSLSDIDTAARAAGPTRGLAKALRRPKGAPMRVLSEIKRASPSAGPIRPGADPAQIAEEYANAGAAAISVLTDKQFFDGDLSFLAKVRARVGVPLLRKDFVIDAYQIAEARAAGADAVLLIVAALERSQLAELMAAAKEYELDALVEVHTLDEADIAYAVGSQLLGVNHRDLKTFTIDMTLTSKIIASITIDTIVVAESGIRGPADVKMLDEARADAILVGEHLMRAPSPGAALRELMGKGES